MMNPQNKKLGVILGVMIAGGLGLGVWLYLAWSAYSTTQDEWASMSQKATTMEGAKVYPSAANVKALDQKISDYRDKFFDLRKVLLDPKLQQPLKPLSETEFQAKVKERAKAVKQKADEAGMKLPPGFALGFEEYSASLPLNADAAAELNIHLDVMEKFVTTLVAAKVGSLDELQRTRLPGEKARETAKAPAPAPVSANQKKGAPALPAPVRSDDVLDRYTIKCTFTTDQGPLQTVMNNLSNAAKTPAFLAVRLIRVENEKTEAPTKDEIKAPPANNPSGFEPPQPSKDAKVQVSNAIVPPKPLPTDARVIIGAEVLKVYMEVDYIRFRQPQSEDAAAPKS